MSTMPAGAMRLQSRYTNSIRHGRDTSFWRPSLRKPTRGGAKIFLNRALSNGMADQWTSQAIRREMCGAGRRRNPLLVCQAIEGPDGDDQASEDESEQKKINNQTEQASENGEGRQSKRRGRREKKEVAQEPLTFDDLNPISMGRKSRAVFDDVWTQLQRIGGPSRTTIAETFDDLPETFDSPQASETTVLVVGATGRVGKVLVRKLLLRGYKVKALVRRRSTTEESEALEAIPQSVEVIEGDLGDYKACRKAVETVDKVIFCAAARSTLTADLNRVDADGVGMLVRAIQDVRNAEARREGSLARSAKVEIADFKNVDCQEAWDIDHVGPPSEDLEKTGFYAERRRKALGQARDTANAIISEDDFLVFEGAVYSRDGYATVSAMLDDDLRSSIASCDGFVMRLLGDQQTYSLVVETEDGRSFSSRFKTGVGFSTIRLPFSLFTPETMAEDVVETVLEPREIVKMSIKFEPKMKAFDQLTLPGQDIYDSAANRFNLQIDWIKALPGGIETDFVLVSCGGAQRSEWGFDPSVREKVVTSKRKGESLLRSSGLGYTIVRPGALVEEAGGYRALVFDQGNRITQPVACADVADVCLKSLHDPLARNKTFEVCWEYTPEEGLENYELVAHLPDKANNYLSPALATLQSNT